MKRKSWIPVLVMAAITLVQGFAVPASRMFPYAAMAEDDSDDSATFSNWSSDSLRTFADSILAISLDSVVLEINPVEFPDSIAHRIDSILRAKFVRDSLAKAREDFQRWFDSIPKKEQKKWTLENVILPRKMHIADSILHYKDSVKTRKDSIRNSIPRILTSPAIPDSLRYKRLLLMTQDKKVGDIIHHVQDTSYNAHFYDYPFFRKDVNATWLGVAGSPAQMYNVTKRDEGEENAVFYSPLSIWGYTPSTLPMYNTKTPYTELAYYGTLLAGDSKEEINVRLLTTQNITPALNVAFEINKFEGNGYMNNSKTRSQNIAFSGNYLGKRYLAHGGWIYNGTERTENGGFVDDMWIRDTTVQSREIDVVLANAKNSYKKNTFFLNHSYRIPFGNDSLTTAFIGHNFEWSTYSKFYEDAISNAAGREFYHNSFNISAGKSADTMKVSKLDNRLYLRLQPWKDGSIVSRIDAGIGDRFLKYHDFLSAPDGQGGTVFSSGDTKQNSLYAFAGARGMFRQYFNWNADARVYFAGHQAGDFSVNAQARVNFYPFRRHRKSPLSLSAHFNTALEEPDHYQQRLLTNHNAWENDFSKKNTMRIGGSLDIPAWKLDADFTYSLYSNAIYYNNLGAVSQCESPVSVMSASIGKEFTLWKFHLDNRALVQLSSDQRVIPVPTLALNLRYFFQFDVVKKVMQMQLGANILFNTLWNMPGYNPSTGTFFNQTDFKYGECPYIDVFLNIQWKRACIFIKGENINQGWPLKNKDYFSAAHYIHTQRTVKFGITWPFYIKPAHSHAPTPDGGHSHGDSHASSHSASGGNQALTAPIGRGMKKANNAK